MEFGNPAVAEEIASAETLLPVVVEVTRGTAVESRHYGHIAVVDGAGKLVAYHGDPHRVTFMRSCAKPFQAIPLITSGAADSYNFTPAEIAIACGSHHGTPEHVHTVTGMLTKLGLTRSALRCGAHPPFNSGGAHDLLKHGAAPTQLHNNCSGKHAGFLAVALKLGASIDDYDWPAHPLQKEIVKALSQFAEYSVAQAPHGFDGCSAPIFAIPLLNMAKAYAKFVNPGADLDAPLFSAAKRIRDAMTACPEMVACVGCFDSEIMRLTEGRILSKGGAESVYCAAVTPTSEWPHGLGIALKIEDGASDRARWPAALAVFDQLDLLPVSTLATLRNLVPHQIRSHRGEVVGRIETVFQLQMF